MNLVQLFKLCRVRVISTQEPRLDAQVPTLSLLLAVFGRAASYESQIKSETTRAGKATARQYRTWTGVAIGKRGPYKHKRERRDYLLTWSGKAEKRGPLLTLEDAERVGVK